MREARRSTSSDGRAARVFEVEQRRQSAVFGQVALVPRGVPNRKNRPPARSSRRVETDLWPLVEEGTHRTGRLIAVAKLEWTTFLVGIVANLAGSIELT